MIEKKETEKLVKEYKTIYKCDICKKEIDEDKYITLQQKFNGGWGNDNIDGCGSSEFCSLECLRKAKTLSSIGNSCLNGLNYEDSEDITFDLEDLTPQQLKELIQLKDFTEYKQRVKEVIINKYAEIEKNTICMECLGGLTELDELLKELGLED